MKTREDDTSLTSEGEREKAEHALRASEAKYRAFFEKLPHGVYQSSPRGKLLAVNPALVRMLGYDSEAELLAVHLVHELYVKPEDRDAWTRKLEEQGELRDVEVVLKRKDGRELTVLDNAHVVRDEQGKVLHYEGTLTDITERKKAEQALRESEERFRAIFDGVNDGILVADIESRKFYLGNNAICRMLGYRPEDIKNFGVTDIHPKENLSYVTEQFDRLARHEIGVAPEIPVKRRDGGIFYADISSSFLTLAGRTYLVGVFRDITERKRMEEDIRKLSLFSESIIDNANVWIDVLDENANVVIWNKAAEVMSGYSREEVVGHGKIWEWLYPDEEYRKQLTDLVAEVIQLGRVEEDVETRIRRKDGQIRIISWNERSLLDEHGKTVGSIAIGRDITERKRMQDELERYSKHLEQLVEERTGKLAESERKYRSLIENIPDIAWTTDRGGRTVFVSPNVAKVSGRTPEEIYAAGGTLWLERIHPDDIERVKEAYEALFAENKTYDVEYRIQRKDRNWVWFHDRSVATYEKDGQQYADGLLSDITERKRVEQRVEEGMLQLRESEAKFRGLYDSIGDGILANDVSGRILECNRAFEDMVGYSLEELRKMKWQDITPEQYLGLEEGMVKEEMLKRGLTTYLQKEYIRKDGSRLPVETTASIVRGTGGNPDMIWCIVRDITERKRIEAELRAAKERLEFVVASNPAVIVTGKPHSDLADFDTTYMSRNLTSMLGYEPKEFIDDPQFWVRHVHPADRDRALAELPRLFKEGHLGYDYRFLHRDGGYRWVHEEMRVVRDATGNPLEVVGYWTDSTEMKRMEQELIKSERLAAIGETVMMVGHDLRNPLQVVVNSVYLGQEMCNSMPSECKTVLKEKGMTNVFGMIEKQVEYMNKIVSDLQDYARPVMPQLVETSLGQLVADTLSAVKIPENIRVSIDAEERLPNAMVDPGLIRRVFTNVITNAVQAMPDGGELSIGLFRSNGSASVSFQDTGVGIPEQNLRKLFRPLFTTKSKGQGLGLAVCRRLVEAHDGTISVESKMGAGTRFTVKIPLGKGVS